MPETNPYLLAEKRRVAQLNKAAEMIAKNDKKYFEGWTKDEVAARIGEILNLPEEQKVEKFNRMLEQPNVYFGARNVTELRNKLADLWNPIDPEKDPEDRVVRYLPTGKLQDYLPSKTKEQISLGSPMTQDLINKGLDEWKQDYYAQSKSEDPYTVQQKAVKQVAASYPHLFEGMDPLEVENNLRAVLTAPKEERQTRLDKLRVPGSFYSNKSVQEIEDDLATRLGIVSPHVESTIQKTAPYNPLAQSVKTALNISDNPAVTTPQPPTKKLLYNPK